MTASQPPAGDREAVARINDPSAWTIVDAHAPYVARHTIPHEDRRLASLAKADAILALRTPSAPSAPDELMTAAEIEAWEAAPSEEGLREAIRRAKIEAEKTYGIAWHALEEISRFELVFAALSASLAPKSGDGV